MTGMTKQPGLLLCPLDKNCVSSAALLLAQAPVEILDDMPQVSDTLLPGLSGKQQQQGETAPPENNVKEAEEQSPKSPKVGKVEVPVARKEWTFKILLIVQDMLLHSSSSSEDVNHQSCQAKVMPSLEMPITAGFHDHSGTSHATGKTSEEMTNTHSTAWPKLPFMHSQSPQDRSPYQNSPHFNNTIL